VSRKRKEDIADSSFQVTDIPSQNTCLISSVFNRQIEGVEVKSSLFTDILRLAK